MPANLLRPGLPQPRNPSLRNQRLGSGAWTPASLSGLVSWFDFSDTSKITASGGAVSDVAPSGGSNTGHLVQATGANQPTTGVDTINGRNTIKFTAASNTYLTITSVTAAQPLTMFFVVKYATTGLANSQLTGFDAVGSVTLYQETGNWALFAGGDIRSATAVDTSAHQLVVLANGGASQIWLGGSSIVSGNAGTSGWGGTFTLGTDSGHTASFNGDFGEFALCTGDQTASQTNWNSYCARWGL